MKIEVSSWENHLIGGLPAERMVNQQLADEHKAFPSAVATASWQAAHVASGHVALHSATIYNLLRAQGAP